MALALGRLAFGSRDRGIEVTYSDFGAALDSGNVAQVEVNPEARQLNGTFKRPTTMNGTRITEFRVMLPFNDPNPVVERLEAKKVPIVARGAGSGWTAMLVSLIPWILIIAVWTIVARQMRSGAGNALAFGRLGAKPVRADRPKVTFADVAGADEAKEELTEVISFLKDPGRFQRLGGRMPKGVLLMGPPGTGKTLLARAVAGEAGVPFFSISGSDFVEMFVGVGASRVRDLFQTGKSNAPCIIFMDELDAVGRLRGAGLGGGNDEREQTLNQLLVELDGFEPSDGVVLLAATNRPDVLDPALLRPGRFDRQIVVDLPDVRGREMILRVHSRKVPLGPDVDLGEIARGTPGLSGADLANLVNEAALLASRRNKSQVGLADFEDAKDKVMLGIERRSLVQTEDERRLTAYHEAGHAILQVVIPGQDPLHKVTIVPRGRALGVTFSLPEQDRHNYTKRYVLGRLVVAYGGRVAEELIFGPEMVTTGAAQDFAQATGLARRMVTEFGMSDAIGPIAAGDREQLVFLGREVGQRHEVSERTAALIDSEVRRLATEAFQRAKNILSAEVASLHALARALLDRETLNRVEVEAILGPVAKSQAGTLPVPEPPPALVPPG
jgi:cell division protease FtsH